MRIWRLIAPAIVAIIAITLPAGTVRTQTKAGKASKSMIERGRYITTVALCNDCHTPKIMTPKGPALDTTRLLSGHPATATLPPYPDSILGMTPDKWLTVGSNDLTAWRGPWGTSYTFNLTPDKETGIGSWTVDMFMKAIRTGKHMGKGRDILPPMPWDLIGRMTDQDLRAVFAYLHSLPPISNAVPDPAPPPGAGHK